MPTFLAYTSPAAGHLFPLMPGLLALRERGHDVHVVTDPRHVADAEAAGIRARGVAASVLAVEFDKAGGGLKQGLAGLIGRGPYESEDLREAIAETGADALLVDTNAYGA